MTRSMRVAVGALLLIALSGPQLSFAEWSTAGRLPPRVFTDRDGLPRNAITSIVFDREGVLWRRGIPL